MRGEEFNIWELFHELQDRALDDLHIAIVVPAAGIPDPDAPRLFLELREIYGLQVVPDIEVQGVRDDIDGLVREQLLNALLDE